MLLLCGLLFVKIDRFRFGFGFGFLGSLSLLENILIFLEDFLDASLLVTGNVTDLILDTLHLGAI